MYCIIKSNLWKQCSTEMLPCSNISFFFSTLGVIFKTCKSREIKVHIGDLVQKIEEMVSVNSVIYLR